MSPFLVQTINFLRKIAHRLDIGISIPAGVNYLSEWGDLNSRPLDPQSSALTGLRYTPKSEPKSGFGAAKIKKYMPDI